MGAFIFPLIVSLVFLGGGIYLYVLIFTSDSFDICRDIIFAVISICFLFIGFFLFIGIIEEIKKEQGEDKEPTKTVVKEPIKMQYTKTVVFEIINNKLTPVDTVVTEYKSF